MDVDPLACEKAAARIDSLTCNDSRGPTELKTYTFLKNFRHIKTVLSEVDENLPDSGVDGILMDLGMSSMQVCFCKNSTDLTFTYCFLFFSFFNEISGM